MSTIAANIQLLRARINSIAALCHRSTDSIRVLAVSKMQPVAAIQEAYAEGITCFGENYVQEALTKMNILAKLAIEWHFIGPIQSNKTKTIAEHFAWVHSLDRFRIAQRLSEQRPAHLPALNVCIQVNLNQEATKAGVSLEQLRELAQQVAMLPQLRLRGLMAIPALTQNSQQQRKNFHALKTALINLQSTLPDLDTLSMGMSDDMEAAIQEGASIIRIGTGIFGPRASKT